MQTSKLIFILLLCSAIFTSCKNEFESEPELGAWKQVASMNDIGNGDTTYRKTESDKTLLFTAYGTVISNQKVCIGNNYKEDTVATWNPGEHTFTVDDCVASYSLDEEKQLLTVSYQCADACGEQFERAE